MQFCSEVARIISLLFIPWLGVACTREPEKPGKADKSEIRESFCQPFPGIILEESRTGVLANGSIVHNELVYPAEYYRVLENETYGCVCKLRACLKKCCGRNEMLGAGDRPSCIQLPSGLPVLDLVLQRSQLATEIQEISGVGDLFTLVEDTGCPKNTIKYMLEPEHFVEDKFVLEPNGTLRTSLNTFPAWSYCLDWKESFKKIGVLVCMSREAIPSTDEQATYKIGIIISIPFFVATFLVYAIIPELRNLYGKTLMCYVACLVVAYTFLAMAKMFHLSVDLCSTIAYIIHFSFLASFFWLNVMCFDIWWTFGGFRSLQGGVKQRERKKFLIYSIYAWGCASLLTGVCIIMNFVRDIPDYLIRPNFGEDSCWFAKYKATAIYFYGPMGVTVFCNICLFVSTAFKIVQHKKDTNHHLKGQDSRRHDDNKQWFNLYLKLFIVMGINWSMEIISWLFNNSPKYLWYLTDLTNTLQGVIIFLIFVWKGKIRLLLLKRFGCHRGDIFSGNSIRSAYHSSTSRTFTTLMAPLQEKGNPYTGEPPRNKPAANRNDSI
ncbi:G-protein coupled receptor Mth2 isoform X3 [Andrena cerasifolii]|uniref:G-protein coupled receptor Mth2 isoform X3 n=1 Tax=Andrena cerasifolii TaxID=2819439 RepID=UPI0040382F88